MSRTIRKNKPRVRSRWLNATSPAGDSKPYDVRFNCTDSRGQNWQCRCEYCRDGKLHKHLRQPQMFVEVDEV